MVARSGVEDAGRALRRIGQHSRPRVGPGWRDDAVRDEKRQIMLCRNVIRAHLVRFGVSVPIKTAWNEASQRASLTLRPSAPLG